MKRRASHCGGRRDRGDRGDRGAVLVETAVVATVLFTLLLAAIAFAISEAGDSSGTNAAREGARRGIVDYDNADVVGSDAFLAIQAAVRARLAGLVSGNPAMTVRCYSAAGAVKSCAKAGIIPGSDQIEVKVTWTKLTSSPFIPNTSKTDMSRMTIVGLLPGRVTPTTIGGECTLTAASATPDSTPLTQSRGRLSSDVTIAVTVSSVDACGSPRITAVGHEPPGVDEYAVAPPIAMARRGTSKVFTYVIVARDGGNVDDESNQSSSAADRWFDGTKTVSIVSPKGGGQATATFQVGSATGPNDEATNTVQSKGNGASSLLPTTRPG